MTSHVIAYRSTELLFRTHTFNFNCFFDDFNCVFTQIRCLSRLLVFAHMLLIPKSHDWLYDDNFSLFFQTIGACNYTLSHPTKETDWTEVSDDTLYFKPVKSHVHHLLGEKECTYGPAFWCASMENARKCNVSIGSL